MAEQAATNARRGKSAAAFRTISEVASELDVPQHVLRFWETKFSQVRPLKRGGGRRYYRPEDVDLLRRIRGLLYDDGYTIKGVQKLLREGGRSNGRDTDVPEPALAGPPPGATPPPAAPKPVAAEKAAGPALSGAQRRAVEAAVRELEELKALLDRGRA